MTRTSPDLDVYLSLSVVLDEKKVDVRIVAALLGAARADDEEDAVLARAIDEVMPVAGFHRKAGAIARTHHAFSFILDEHELARDHDEEFILLLMPVPERGPGAGLDTNEIGAELREACCVAEPSPMASAAGLAERRRIEAAARLGDLCDVDLRHDRLSFLRSITARGATPDRGSRFGSAGRVRPAR